MHGKKTNGPMIARKVDRRSLSRTEGGGTVLKPHEKLTVGHAAALKVAESLWPH